MSVRLFLNGFLGPPDGEANITVLNGRNRQVDDAANTTQDYAGQVVPESKQEGA